MRDSLAAHIRTKVPASNDTSQILLVLEILGPLRKTVKAAPQPGEARPESALLGYLPALRGLSIDKNGLSHFNDNVCRQSSPGRQY